MTIYFASLRLCVKFGSQSREDAKIIKDHICEKHSTTNLFCGMVLVTDSHILYYYLDGESKNISDFINIISKSNFLDYEGDNLEYDLTDFLLSNAVYHSYLKIEI